MIVNRKSSKKSCPIVTESFRGQEFYLFSSDNPNLLSDNLLRFWKKLFEEMSTSKTIKATNNKIEQSKAQYNLDRKATRIFALSSVNVFYPQKTLLEKSCWNQKRFECFAVFVVGWKKKKTSVAEQQYPRFNKLFKSDKN